MVSASWFTALCLAGNVAAQINTYTATGTAAVKAAQATALTSSPTSNVKGKAFDRIAIIWLENTDYSLAAADPNLAALAAQGITLTKNFAVTHPSQPNYIASHGGDNFGMDNDNFNQIAQNVSSIFDLLDAKGISWGEYQEDMPYSGFEGIAYINQVNKANDYVRKHNPGVSYDSAAVSAQRLSQMKNFTVFYSDLAANKLPQWMFITPNMTNDGHDTSVTVAGTFCHNFVTPLLTNPNFMNNTVVLITFDENHSYGIQNNIMGILLGDAIPSSLVGTSDANYYNHYSQLSTVEANWGLHTLGRWDVGANVFAFAAAKTGDTLRKWPASPPFSSYYFNSSYPGPFNSVNHSVPYPVPNTAAKYAGRTVLPSIVTKWKKLVKKTFYTTGVAIPDGMHPPAGY